MRPTDELISRRVALEHLEHCYNANECRGIIEELPAVDNVEVIKYGEWELIWEGTYFVPKCSICKRKLKNESSIKRKEPEYNRCPYCGAVLSGKNHEKVN